MRAPGSTVAALCLTLSACAGVRPTPVEPSTPFLLVTGDLVAAVVAEEGDSLGGSAREAIARHEVLAVLRQSALDWLDQRQQFDRLGVLRVIVSVREVRLRSGIVARWFDFMAGEDLLAAVVSVYRGAELVKTFVVRTSSRLGGSSWRDPADRMRRLSQQLGRQVADGL